MPPSRTKKQTTYGSFTHSYCNHCNKSFLAVSESQKYCSNKCTQEARLEISKMAKEQKMIMGGC